MVKITIITPTYNRSSELKVLYNSLKKQSNKSFQWLVIDDGSTDDTSSYIEGCKKESYVSIHYLYNTNAGKMAALLNGLKKVDTEYVICVDSDDYLESTAIEVMLNDLDAIEKLSKSDINGIIYPQNNESISSKWIDKKFEKIMNFKYIHDIGETAILFKTDKVKSIDVKTYINEKFLSEEVLYNRLDDNGFMYVGKHRFYCSKYREDGLTNSVFLIWLKNPNGTFELLKSRYAAVKKLPLYYRIREKCKCILNYNAFCIANDKSIRKESPDRVLSLLLYVPSRFFYSWRFKNAK